MAEAHPKADHANGETSRPGAISGITLAVLLASAIGTFVASDFFLTGNDRFWRFCLRSTATTNSMPLRTEANLAIRDADSVEIAILGSSVAPRDIGPAHLANSLGLPERAAVLAWLPGANAVELAMLTPELVRLRPRDVILLVTPWTLDGRIGYDELRLYDAGMAFAIFGPRRLIDRHTDHAGYLLASSHVVVRHRRGLREVLFGPLLARTSFGRQDAAWTTDPRARDRWRIRQSTRESDFNCQNVQTRAIEAMAAELSSAGINLVLAVAPTKLKWERNTTVRSMLDSCLPGLAKTAGIGFIGRRDLPEFSRSDFADAVHLNAEAKPVYTLALAENLARIAKERGTPYPDAVR